MLDWNSIIQALGGLGVFLLGMITMTDSLKQLAGQRLRTFLLDFTRTPTSGAITGAITTAVVQSSSATTVAAVGFVGAGLMAFSHALGIIFGANIGTTITGWMVAIFGFKLSIDALAFPIVLLGVMLRLFAQGRLAQIGLALAGFGLLFIGLDLLQASMISLKEVFDFSTLPSNSFWGLIQLLFLGLAFTLITQSSSAGVAITLTALFSDLIVFEQAAALVIGMDIGTTVTSLLASIGGTVGARRTGLSHVVYNFITALLALLLIAPYTWIWQQIDPAGLENQAELALVGFHTLFNIVGVLLILPFAHRFAQLIIWMVPDKPSRISQECEPSLLDTPDLALNAVQVSLYELNQDLLKLLLDRLHNRTVTSQHLNELQNELNQVETYIDQIHLARSESEQWAQLISLLHALDHMQRLHERCEEEADRAAASHAFQTLNKAHQQMLTSVHHILHQTEQQQWDEAVQQSKQLYHQLQASAEGYRQQMVHAMGVGELSAESCSDGLEAIRWMNRISRHLYRMTHHFQKSYWAQRSNTPSEKH